MNSYHILYLGNQCFTTCPHPMNQLSFKLQTFCHKIVWYILHQVSSNWWNSETRLCIALPLIPQLNFKLNKTFKTNCNLCFLCKFPSCRKLWGNWLKIWSRFWRWQTAKFPDLSLAAQSENPSKDFLPLCWIKAPWIHLARHTPRRCRRQHITFLAKSCGWLLKAKTWHHVLVYIQRLLQRLNFYSGTDQQWEGHFLTLLGTPFTIWLSPSFGCRILERSGVD